LKSIIYLDGKSPSIPRRIVLRGEGEQDDVSSGSKKCFFIDLRKIANKEFNKKRGVLKTINKNKTLEMI